MKKLLSLLEYGPIAALALPLLALAQGSTDVPIQAAPTNITSVPALLGKVCTAINFLFTGLIILSIFFVLLAAYKYLTARGEAEKITEANHEILYAAIAVGIGIVAKGVPIAIGLFLGSTFTACGAGGTGV